MRVLFVTNIPSPYRVDFFNELGSLCELTVLFERNNAKDRNGDWLSNQFKNFNGIFLRGSDVGNDSAISFQVIKYLNKSYDIIVIGGYSTPTGMLAITYLKLKKIPFILNADGGFIKNDSGLKYKLKNYFISNASAYLSSGKKTSEYLEYYGAKKSAIFTYPFTSLKKEDILTEIVGEIEKKGLKKKLEINKEKVVLSIGQFIHRKGFDVLLKACKKIDKSVGIYIIGGEPTEEYLDMQQKMSLTNVYFLDFMRKEELAEYYKVADLFVLPTREDIWGLVVNEAMGYGLPVITTNCCIAGLELIDKGKNGHVIEMGNSKQIAEKINDVLFGGFKENFNVQFCLEKAQKYTIENMAMEHHRIFNLVVGGGKE